MKVQQWFQISSSSLFPSSWVDLQNVVLYLNWHFPSPCSESANQKWLTHDSFRRKWSTQLVDNGNIACHPLLIGKMLFIEAAPYIRWIDFFSSLANCSFQTTWQWFFTHERVALHGLKCAQQARKLKRSIGKRRDIKCLRIHLCNSTWFSICISFWNFSHSSSTGSLYSTFLAWDKIERQQEFLSNGILISGSQN